MRAKTNTITINGQAYDSTTGRVVDGIVRAKAAQPKTKSASHAAVVSDSHKVTVRIASDGDSKRQTVPVHRVASRPVGRHAEKSKTLMRTVVKRPAQPKRAHGVSGLTQQPKTLVVAHGASKPKHQSTLQHAKSPSITKFASSQTVIKKTVHLPVTPAPVSGQTHHTRYDISNTPPTPTVKKTDLPLHMLHQDLFETALQGASSHKAKPLKRTRSRRKRLMQLGASAMTVALLVAFYAYQNAPNLALKRASSTIGFNAQIPGYRPNGYRLAGPVQYSPGKVSLAFHSTTDSSNYTLTQQASQLNEAGLAANFLSGHNYQRVSANGHSGFVYDGSNITWINNGVWYNLSGTAKLSEEQLVKIASSLL